MKSLPISQMEDSNYGDAWLDMSLRACAFWTVGRALFGISISCAASPLAGIICTKIVDGYCAVVGIAGLAE